MSQAVAEIKVTEHKIRTVKAIIEGPSREPLAAKIYVISDEHSQVLYVGQTILSMKRRFLGHIKSRSILGNLMSLPDGRADNWTVSIMSINHWLDLAEADLIKRYQPLLNSQRPELTRPVHWNVAGA